GVAEVSQGGYLIMAGVVETPTYYPGTRTLSSAKPIEITAGKTVSGIDFRIERVSTGLTVSGRVRREAAPFSGSPGEQITMRAGDQSFLTASVKLDGSFEFQKVRPDN